MKQSKGALRWKFKKVMDELDIGTLELAAFMKVDKSTVSEWRKADYFPKISEIRWLQICEAMNEMCRLRGKKVKVQPLDLIEFCPDEVRDFELLDYQYASGDARKKSSSKEKDKTDGSVKNTVAA
jgi:DNA-binding Xre family transcriptional regulator